MKKKFFKIAIFNILAIFLILMISEAVIWQNDNRILHKNKILDKDLMIRFHPGIKNFELTPDNFPNPESNYGRNPVGLEYNKSPIVIFGCSYAYGYLLNENQSFSYKLSHLTKRPVYNRASTGWGIQHMLYQTNQEYLYNIIPEEPEYVIYVFIDDHLRRLYLLSFDEWTRAAENLYLRYKEQNGKLIKINNQNIFSNQIKRLYTVSKIQSLLIRNKLKEEENYKKAQDFALKLFLESRNNMQKHWKNTKYVIYFYSNYKQQYLMDNLKANDFIVFSSEDITNDNLYTPKYIINDYHPNEAAWNLLTPKIAEYLNL